VIAVQPELAEAAIVVHAASDAGLSAATNVAELAESASPETLKRYRALAPAVETMNRIAAVRSRLCEVPWYGPDSAEPGGAVASFLSGVTGAGQLQGAINLWAGQFETVQLNMPFMGSSLAQQPRKRLGGAWFALVNGGHTLRLNSAAETLEVLASARKAA